MNVKTIGMHLTECIKMCIGFRLVEIVSGAFLCGWIIILTVSEMPDFRKIGTIESKNKLEKRIVSV
jgi:hypothetical protein